MPGTAKLLHQSLQFVHGDHGDLGARQTEIPKRGPVPLQKRPGFRRQIERGRVVTAEAAVRLREVCPAEFLLMLWAITQSTPNSNSVKASGWLPRTAAAPGGNRELGPGPKHPAAAYLSQLVRTVGHFRLGIGDPHLD